jgi:hypothetical protein
LGLACQSTKESLLGYTKKYGMISTSNPVAWKFTIHFRQIVAPVIALPDPAGRAWFPWPIYQWYPHLVGFAGILKDGALAISFVLSGVRLIWTTI